MQLIIFFSVFFLVCTSLYTFHPVILQTLLDLKKAGPDVLTVLSSIFWKHEQIYTFSLTCTRNLLFFTQREGYHIKYAFEATFIYLSVFRCEWICSSQLNMYIIETYMLVFKGECVYFYRKKNIAPVY